MDEPKEEVIIWGGLIRKRLAWEGSADEVITEDSCLLSRMGLFHLDILRRGELGRGEGGGRNFEEIIKGGMTTSHDLWS